MGFVAAAALFMACNSTPKQEVKVDGDWTFSEFVEGKAELNPQNQAMIQSIVKLFKDGSVSFKDGKINIQSPVAGKRSGTYTIEDGKLNAALGGNSQFSLHVANEAGNLVILFNEDGSQETGKIVLKK